MPRLGNVFLGIVFAIAGLSQSVLANAVPVDLSPIDHRAASLEVNGQRGVSIYTPAQIEALGAYRVITRTPWRSEDTVFEGALLSDILRANGISDASAIRVIAENDYAITIPAQVWQQWPVLVATRVNGKPHNRRERGPIQFVLPMNDNQALGEGSNVDYWVWMAARIELAQ